MHNSIIQEIVDWQMWQRIAGKEPKQIKLAPHHMRALKKWLDTIPLYPCASSEGFTKWPKQESRILGMEIIEA